MTAVEEESTRQAGEARQASMCVLSGEMVVIYLCELFPSAAAIQCQCLGESVGVCHGR